MLGIYKCSVGFKYTKYYLSLIAIAEDKNDAKKEFIKECLQNYDIIKHIEFDMFYDKDDKGDEPLCFQNISDLERYLMDNIIEDIIEYIGQSHFEIKDKYDI